LTQRLPEGTVALHHNVGAINVMTTVSKFTDSWVADPDLHATDGTDAQ
jgi:hypothetical protein